MISKTSGVGLQSWDGLTFIEQKLNFIGIFIILYLKRGKLFIFERKGKISKVQADRKAIAEYEEFNKTQKIISDFDKEIKKLKGDGSR